MNNYGWLNVAACKDSNPMWFTELSPRSWDALGMCTRCPVLDECESWVSPSNNRFDGVVGGKLWRNGKEMTDIETMLAESALWEVE